MKVLAKIRKVIDVVLGSACALVFALMVCIGTYQIVKRLILNDPSTVSEELLTYSFTWMALLASAYVFGKRDHMRMGFLADKLTGTPRSEEHTSELQSRFDLVCRLLLEKKKQIS